MEDITVRFGISICREVEATPKRKVKANSVLLWFPLLAFHEVLREIPEEKWGCGIGVVLECEDEGEKVEDGQTGVNVLLAGLVLQWAGTIHDFFFK